MFSKNAVSALGVQACRGLVQNQHIRFHGNDAGNGHPALLAAGEVKGGLLQMLLGHPHKGRRLPDPPLDLLRRQTHVLGAKGNVLVHSLFKKLILRVLKYQADMKPNASGKGLVAPDVPPVEENLPGRGLQQAIEMLNQGGFSGAGVSDDVPMNSPPLHGKAHMLNGGALKGRSNAVYVGKVPNLKNWCQFSFLQRVRPTPSGAVPARILLSSGYPAAAPAPAFLSCQHSSTVSGADRPRRCSSSTWLKTFFGGPSAAISPGPGPPPAAPGRPHPCGG